MAGPLAGVRIIEVAGIGPGPFAAMMLADMGAEVIRVERAQAVRGPAPDAPGWDVLQRGRRNLALDLKHPDGVEALLSLVERADALIEGFRPGRHGAPRASGPTCAWPATRSSSSAA